MTGLVRLKEQLLILLDVDRLFGDEESAALTGAGAAAGAPSRPSSPGSTGSCRKWQGTPMMLD